MRFWRTAVSWQCWSVSVALEIMNILIRCSTSAKCKIFSLLPVSIVANKKCHLSPLYSSNHNGIISAKNAHQWERMSTVYEENYLLQNSGQGARVILRKLNTFRRLFCFCLVTWLLLKKRGALGNSNFCIFINKPWYKHSLLWLIQIVYRRKRIQRTRD